MTKWTLLFLAAAVILAIIGFLIDAAQAIAGFLFFVCLIALGVQYARRRGQRRVTGPPP